MCNFNALFPWVLFLYAGLLRSEGRTTESAVYLLWSVHRIMCFCEAEWTVWLLRAKGGTLQYSVVHIKYCSRIVDSQTAAHWPNICQMFCSFYAVWRKKHSKYQFLLLLLQGEYFNHFISHAVLRACCPVYKHIRLLIVHVFMDLNFF